MAVIAHAQVLWKNEGEASDQLSVGIGRLHQRHNVWGYLKGRVRISKAETKMGQKTGLGEDVNGKNRWC